MKYFKVTYVSQKTLHPEGYKTFNAFVAAETKHIAKLKSLEVLAQKDPDCRMMYKVPRLEEFSESEYVKQTEIQRDWVDEETTSRYCALLSLFGEEEEYDDDERRDADELIASPDEEQEAYARYDALYQQVYEALPDDATEETMQALAKRLWADMKAVSSVAPAVEAESLNLQAKPGLPTESVGNTEDSGENSSDINRSRDAVPLAENAPDNDDQSCGSDETIARDWPDLELDIARALWEGELHWEAIPSEVEQWAQKMVKRRDVEMTRWLLALRKVPDILSRSREFIFKVIRTPHAPEIYLTPEAIDAYVARFVEPETTVASETADVPAIAESETVDAEVTGSGIHYSPEEDMPAFLRDLKPVNGAVEDGRLFATVDALNARLADIPVAGGLVLWGLDNALYHAADGYSSTQIRLVNRGGIAALDWYQNAPRKSQESPALTLGTALHTAILEPERFATEYACAPSVNLRTNEGKERLASFEADCAERGMTPLKREDFDTVCLMRDSALAYPTVASLLESGVAELSLFCRMENGLLLKVRPDWLGEFVGAPFLLDIKTTDDVLDFGKSVEKFGYHLQAAFYEFVMAQVFGLGVDFAFCAISKRQECGRYPVLLGVLDEEDGYTGRQLIEETLLHLATGHSHSSSGLATVSRPWWAKQADRKRREAQGVMA